MSTEQTITLIFLLFLTIAVWINFLVWPSPLGLGAALIVTLILALFSGFAHERF